MSSVRVEWHAWRVEEGWVGWSSQVGGYCASVGSAAKCWLGDGE